MCLETSDYVGVGGVGGGGGGAVGKCAHARLSPVTPVHICFYVRGSLQRLRRFVSDV